MQTVRNIIQRLITSDLKIERITFSVEGVKKKFSIDAPKGNKELFFGDKDLAKYADYIADDQPLDEDGTFDLGMLYEHKGDLNCIMCLGKGIVTEGEHDDVREVACPCTLDEPADFSGATEGDR